MGNVITFRVFKYPVHVHWTAALLLLIIGFSQSSGQVSASGLIMAVLVAVVVLFSVLVHELGHAFAADRLGLRTLDIMLHGMGGQCRYQGHTSHKNRMLVSLAGPAAGLGLGLVGATLWFTVGNSLPSPLRQLVWVLFTVNVFWTVFNLLPMWPLDGGHALSSGLMMKMKTSKATSISTWVSLVIGALVTLYGVTSGEFFLAIIGGMVLMENWRRR